MAESLPIHLVLVQHVDERSLHSEHGFGGSNDGSRGNHGVTRDIRGIVWVDKEGERDDKV
jgi:hypothetical protein